MRGELDWEGLRVVVTGGAGFIGSNLVRELCSFGANVTVLDNYLSEGGALEQNLLGAKATVFREDIRYADLSGFFAGADVLFNLAAQTGHMQAQRQPLEDLEINTVAQLRLIAALRQVAPTVIVVHASTRQVYGRPMELPVSEAHPVRPPDANAVSKLAGETYWMLEHAVHGRRVVGLRLTNTYGPRQRIIDANQNFLGLWFGKVLQGEPFEVWDGQQLRDLAYVDDVVAALIKAAETPECYGHILNIGGAAPVTLLDLATHLKALTGCAFSVRPFPRENSLIDVGSYYSDDSAFRRATGWAPQMDLESGLAETLKWFRPHIEAYTGQRHRQRT